MAASTSTTAATTAKPRRFRFTVYGIPVPKGSARGFVLMKANQKARAVITHDNKRTAPWQQDVLNAALDAMGRLAPGAAPLPQLRGPVQLVVRFYLPRPASAPRRERWPWHQRGSDLDKLLRCIKDGLTRAGVYRDDVQVCGGQQVKAFAGGEHDPDGPAGIPRAVIEVEEIPEERPPDRGTRSAGAAG